MCPSNHSLIQWWVSLISCHMNETIIWYKFSAEIPIRSAKLQSDYYVIILYYIMKARQTLRSAAMGNLSFSVFRFFYACQNSKIPNGKKSKIFNSEFTWCRSTAWKKQITTISHMTIAAISVFSFGQSNNRIVQNQNAYWYRAIYWITQVWLQAMAQIWICKIFKITRTQLFFCQWVSSRLFNVINPQWRYVSINGEWLQLMRCARLSEF